MKLLVVFLTTLCYLASLTAGTQLIRARDSAADIILADILKPILNFLECKRGDETVQLLCRLVAGQVDSALAAANIRVDASGILFSYNDPTHRGIDTGHSCTVTAEITGITANAKLLASASLDFSGNPLGISDPAVFVAELPVNLFARADVKERFGVKVPLAGCTNLGSDSFYASGSLQTTARLAVLFTFAPTLKVDAGGNYVLTIKPITKVGAQLTNTNIDFNISGVSFLNGLVTAILGGTSSLTKALVGILKGDGLGAVWNNIKQHFIDNIVGTLLSLPSELLEDLVVVLAKSYVEEKQVGIAQQYSGELENKFRALVTDVLHLDANGERQFILKKNFVDLVRQFGDGADIWLPARPAGYCLGDSDCDDGRFCNGIERCVNERCVAGTPPCAGDREIRCGEAQKTCIYVPTCGGRTGKICPKE